MKRLLLMTLALVSAQTHAQDYHDKWFGERGGLDGIGGFMIVAGAATKTEESHCFMSKEYDGPGETTLVLQRYSNAPELIFVRLANKNWSIKTGENVDVEYWLDDTRWDREAEGTNIGNKQGLLSGFRADEFSPLFAKASTLFIRHKGGKTIDQLDLTGSAAAIATFNGACWNYALASQRAADAEKRRWEHIPEDPFKK